MPLTKHRPPTHKLHEIQFLRDFDFLTQIKHHQKPLYGPPDLHHQLHTLNNYVSDSQNNSFTLNVDIEEFKVFGPGIYLLFKFLKFVVLLFGITSIVSFINVGITGSSTNSAGYGEVNGFKNMILTTTFQNTQPEHFGLVVGFNVLIILIIAGGLIFWNEKQNKYVYQCLKENSLASYYTVILNKLPEHYNEITMKEYLQANYGPVTEIYTVRKFGDDLTPYKDMTDIANQYKQEKALHALDQDEGRNCKKLARLFLEFRNGHHKIKEKIKNSEHYCFCFAFIQFKKSEHRDQLLDDASSLLRCFDKKVHEDSDQNSKSGYRREELEFQACEMEPNGIRWENLHLSQSQKCLKTTIILVLMLIILVMSIFLISSLSAIEMGINNTIYSKMSKEQILALNDDFASLSYCLRLPLSEYSQQQKLCEQYDSKYIQMISLVLLIPVSISFFKFLLTELMKLVVTYRRYSYEIKKIESQAIILFIFYFLVTGGIQLIVYLSFDSEESSFLNMFTLLIRQVIHPDFSASKVILTHDYTPDWYLVSAYNITIIGAISFNLSALGIIFYCAIRKRLFTSIAKKQPLQIQMNKWLQGYKLQIEYFYASILTIIFFTLLFGGIMPLLYPLSFISFSIQFWAYKYIFIKFCEKPFVFNHCINRRARQLIFGAVIMHCFITPIFYQAPGIGNSSQVNLNLFQRIFKMWYYFLIAIILILYQIGRRPISKLVTAFQRYRQKHQEEIKTENNMLEIPKILSNNKKPSLPPEIRSVTDSKPHESYSIHASPSLKNILLTLYTLNNRERSRGTCLLNRELFHLYQDSIKTNQDEQFNTIIDLIKLVRRDYKKFEGQYKQARNPYEQLKRKMYEIYIECQGGKFTSYTINEINYEYNRIDYVCQKLEEENGTNFSFNTYKQYLMEEQKGSQLEEVKEAQQCKEYTLSKGEESKQSEIQKDANLYPQQSENRLISGGSI